MRKRKEKVVKLFFIEEKITVTGIQLQMLSGLANTDGEDEKSGGWMNFDPPFAARTCAALEKLGFIEANEGYFRITEAGRDFLR